MLEDNSYHEIFRRETNIKETKILPDYATHNLSTTTPTAPVTPKKNDTTTFVPHNVGVNGTGQRKDIPKPDIDKSADKSILLGKTPKPEFTSTTTTTMAPKINITMDDDDSFALGHNTDEIYNKTIENFNKNSEKNKLKTEEVRHLFFILNLGLGNKKNYEWKYSCKLLFPHFIKNHFSIHN